MRLRFGFGATAVWLSAFLWDTYTCVAFTATTCATMASSRTAPCHHEQKRVLILLGLANDHEHEHDNEIAPPPLLQEPTIALAAAAAAVQVTFPFPRASKISSIVLGGMVAPLVQSIVTKGMPTTDWEEFWGRTNGPEDNDNENANHNANNNNNNAKIVTQALEALGPTYVKFGQALSARPDIIPRTLANALATLQDQMQPFDTTQAKEIIRVELSSRIGMGDDQNDDQQQQQQELELLLASLSTQPVAAASIGQVYSATYQNQKVAIKVKRPGIRVIVDQDAALLKWVVTFLESIPALPYTGTDTDTSKSKNSSGRRLIATELVGAVEEFMSRLLEELDYQQEAKNIALFGRLYSHRRREPNTNGDDPSELNSKSKSKSTPASNINVVVPKVYPQLCTNNVIVMEWIDGTKLVEDQTLMDPAAKQENLRLIQQGIECTLSQLLDTGVLHADPHGGNLLKCVETNMDDDGSTITTTVRLGYVDFGLLSTVPAQVRDGLVCAVAQMVFSKNVQAVADLFGDLMLLPPHVLADPTERAALTQALDQTLQEVLQYPTIPTSADSTTTTTTTTIPSLRFDKLLDGLARLVPRFQFQLPPYFLNNARALGTLEGMAREIDPSFNVLQVVYPYALNRLLSNPSNSPVVAATLQSLIRNPMTRRVDVKRVRKLLDDSKALTGYSRRKLMKDILSSGAGSDLARMVVKEQLMTNQPWAKVSNYLRL
jgi:aarF domain-containing kinase